MGATSSRKFHRACNKPPQKAFPIWLRQVKRRRNERNFPNCLQLTAKWDSGWFGVWAMRRAWNSIPFKRNFSDKEEECRRRGIYWETTSLINSTLHVHTARKLETSAWQQPVDPQETQAESLKFLVISQSQCACKSMFKRRLKRQLCRFSSYKVVVLVSMRNEKPFTRIQTVFASFVICEHCSQSRLPPRKAEKTLGRLAIKVISRHDTRRVSFQFFPHSKR